MKRKALHRVRDFVVLFITLTSSGHVYAQIGSERLYTQTAQLTNALDSLKENVIGVSNLQVRNSCNL